MWMIKVTSLNEDPIYINVDMIGHFYEVEETRSYGTVDKPKHTRIGVTTYNNGGFEVKETASELAKLIINAGNTLNSLIKDKSY
jgi:hypothetical protein